MVIASRELKICSDGKKQTNKFPQYIGGMGTDICLTSHHRKWKGGNNQEAGKLEEAWELTFV
jgi:hypothetical protein